MAKQIETFEPPHNTGAEQSLLGALLFNNNILGRLPEALTADSFYFPVHKKLYSLIVKQIEAGKVADGVSLRDALRADELLQEAGGVAYLATLMSAAAPLDKHAVDYAGLIVDAARRRAVIGLARDIIDGAARGDDADRVLDSALDALSSIAATEDVRLARTAGQAARDFIAQLDDPHAAAISTGIDSLDRRLGGGFVRGDLVIVCGRPSAGKTALANNFARNLARGGHTGLIFSQEMSAEALMMRALAAQSFGRPNEVFAYSKLRNGAPSISRDLLKRLADELSGLPLLIDDRAGITIPQIGRACRAARQKMKALDFVVVDYLQILGRPESKGRNDAAIVGEMTRALKTLARNLGVVVIALSQLSRQVEQRDDKRPTLSDLRESGAIEQDADVVMGVYREAYYLSRAEPHSRASDADYVEWQKKLEACAHDMEVLTLKQRQGPVGSDELQAFVEFDMIRDAPRRARGGIGS